jgi:uncharacterized protein (TIGR02147 family)
LTLRINNGTLRFAMKTSAYYITCLEEEFARRCERNPRYSLRAFARALGVSDGALSEIFHGKRIPRPSTLQRIFMKLALTPEDQRRFTASIGDIQRSRGLQRISPVFRFAPEQVPAVRDWSLEMFRVISDWYHLAIVELTYVEGFRPEPAWIAGQLGISIPETRQAIRRLLELGILEERDGALRKSDEQTTTADKHLTTPALRRYQRQVLEKARDSLENDPIDRRSMTGMTFAIDPALLPEAKRKIEKFTQELTRFLESKSRRRVYQMAIALYPLQKEQTA